MVDINKFQRIQVDAALALNVGRIIIIHGSRKVNTFHFVLHLERSERNGHGNE